MNRAPLLLAIVLLLLPVLYLASYLALVVPRGIAHAWHYSYYRIDNRWVDRAFWPLEQIDRRIRPRAWVRPFDEPAIHS